MALMTIKISMIVKDLVYALEEHKIYFNEDDKSFIINIEDRKLTERQEHAAEVIWDKRLKGREDYTKWNMDNGVVFDGKLYGELLEKVSSLYVDLEDEDPVFTDWERIFIDDIYAKYHPDNYAQESQEGFNPILSERQMEHVERIYEQMNK
jgi:hypothetical protein